MVWDYLVVALCGIIWTICKTGPAQSRDLGLECLNVWWVRGSAARTGAERPRIDGLLCFRIVDHFLGPDTEQGGEIGFVEVDNSKTGRKALATFLSSAKPAQARLRYSGGQGV